MASLKLRGLHFWLLLVLVVHPSLLAQGLSLVQPQEVGMSAERLQRLSDVIQGYVDDERLAGAVALVARRGKVGYLETFGHRDRESNAPMKEGTIFRIASQTKAVVSVGVMILQEQGRLLITDPVGKYLPEFLKTSVAVPTEDGKYRIEEARRPITIRDLLTHTSGISYGNGVARDRWSEAQIQGWYFADRDEPIGATVSRIATLPFDAHPGERWIYGFSIDILGALIERVSGLTLEDFLRSRILEPLGMRDTHFYLPPAKSDRLAVVYSAREEGGIERAPDPGHMVGQGAYLEGPRKSFSGGAGLLSTAGDYARFLQMLLNGGELYGTRILAPKTVQLMTVNHLGSLEFRNGLGFGLGFSVVQDLGARGVPGSVGEFGWGGAYHSRYWVDPQEQLLVVYLTQLIPANNLDDQEKVRILTYQALVD